MNLKDDVYYVHEIQKSVGQRKYRVTAQSHLNNIIEDV